MGALWKKVAMQHGRYLYFDRSKCHLSQEWKKMLSGSSWCHNWSESANPFRVWKKLTGKRQNYGDHQRGEISCWNNFLKPDCEMYRQKLNASIVGRYLDHSEFLQHACACPSSKTYFQIFIWVLFFIIIHETRESFSPWLHVSGGAVSLQHSTWIGNYRFIGVGRGEMTQPIIPVGYKMSTTLKVSWQWSSYD